MGAAAYNRGSRIGHKEADERIAGVALRADRQAHKDEIARLRDRVAALEHDLRRARRCLAAERAGRESLRVRLANEERSHAFTADILCHIARRAGVPGFVESDDLKHATNEDAKR